MCLGRSKNSKNKNNSQFAVLVKMRGGYKSDCQETILNPAGQLKERPDYGHETGGIAQHVY